MKQSELNLQKLLARSVAEILRQAIDLLGAIDDRIYTKAERPALADGGAIGGHFRHCLEFINCFLAGVENGHVDYNKRERSREIETNRKYAIAEFTKTVLILENFAPPKTGKVLLVKPEDAAHDENEDLWCASSVERELEFLQSHTIHHYALIGFKLRAFGFDLPPEFGVAPSTLRFWKQEKSAGR